MSKYVTFYGGPMAAGHNVKDTPAGETPEALVAKIMEQFHERGLKREEFGQQSKLAKEKAGYDEAAATTQEQRVQARPQSDAAKIAQDVAAGRITKEQGDALIDKLSAPSASEMKAGNELQNQHLGVQGALSDLKEARDLLGPDGSGVRAGAGGGATQIGAKWGGDALGLSDPKLTQRTERFNQIMSAEAITTMAEKLKGASTDFEMRQFIALMNDPNAEPATKVAALNKMIAKAEAHATLQQEQMKRAKVSAPAGPAAATAAADPNAEAKAWLAANPNDPRAEAVRKKLEGK